MPKTEITCPICGETAERTEDEKAIVVKCDHCGYHAWTDKQ